MDRDLQKAISKGSKLKKTVTNDRSGPIVEKAKTGGGGSGGSSSGGGGIGGPFAGGVPQLRPSGPRSDIRMNASLPVKSSLPSANSGFGPKSSVPASRPQNAFGNGPVPPPPPREPGAGVMKATPRPSFTPQRAPAPSLANTRPPPPPNRGLPNIPNVSNVSNPSRPAPPSGFKTNTPPSGFKTNTPPSGIKTNTPTHSTNDPAKTSPFARAGAPALPPNFRGTGQMGGAPRPPAPDHKTSFGSNTKPSPYGSSNRTSSMGLGSGSSFGGSSGKIPTPPPNIPNTSGSSKAPQHSNPPPPSRFNNQPKTVAPPKTSAPLPSRPNVAQSVPVNRSNFPPLPGRGPPVKQESTNMPPPPTRSNPPPPPPFSNKLLTGNSISEDTSPLHSLPNRQRTVAPPPPPGGRGTFKSTSPPPALPSNRGPPPPLPPARATTPPLNNPPPLPDRDRGMGTRAFSPNGTARSAPPPPSGGMSSAQDLDRKFNFPKDLPQPIAFKSIPKTYPSHDQDQARSRPQMRIPAPIVTDPTKRPPPPPPPV